VKNWLTFGEVMGNSLVSCFFDSRCSELLVDSNDFTERVFLSISYRQILQSLGNHAASHMQ